MADPKIKYDIEAAVKGEADAEALAKTLRGVGDVLEGDLQKSAQGAAQALEHLRPHLRLGHATDQIEVVPLALHLQLGVQVAQHRADVLRQLADELLAHRPALDGDFRAGFDDQFHEVAGAGQDAKKQGRGL